MKAYSIVFAASQILSSMNFSVDPCDDFFAFACDNYIADHPPVARKQFSVFHELIDRTQKQVQGSVPQNLFIIKSSFYTET